MMGKSRGKGSNGRGGLSKDGGGSSGSQGQDRAEGSTGGGDRGCGRRVGQGKGENKRPRRDSLSGSSICTVMMKGRWVGRLSVVT